MKSISTTINLEIWVTITKLTFRISRGYDRFYSFSFIPPLRCDVLNEPITEGCLTYLESVKTFKEIEQIIL